MPHVAQERYSKLVDKKLRATLVTKDNLIFNTSYEGSPTGGKVKIPVRDTEVAVGDYDKAKGMELGAGSTTYIDLDLNHDKAVNEVIDNYDAASVPDGIVAERLDSAGYSLGQVIDAVCIDTLEKEGTSEEAAAPTKSNIYDTVVDLRTKLSEKNVPTEGRWLIVSPQIYALLLKDTTNFIRQGNLSQELIENGAVGKIAGFTVFECSRLAVAKEGQVEGKLSTTNMIAGHPNWCHRVEEWSVPVAIKGLTNNFIGASAVQGRKVFGAKVSKKDAVIVHRTTSAVSAE